MENAAAQGTIRHLTVGQGLDAREIALIYRPGTSADKPLLVWLGGYRSDMEGTKALEMEKLGIELGLSTLRFDYSGHGQSGGAFREGTISRWLEESLAVVEAHPHSNVILVGSSMGGWIALRAVQELRKRGTSKVTGLVLIAPAPDFTHELIEPALSDAERRQLEEKGYFEEPSEYSPEPNIFTRALLEDGRENRVLTGMIETGCPVHILQGMKDPDVPFAHALKLVEFLPADDVVLTLIRDGDHRLSRPQDIERMRAAISAMD
ncbi:alpha/beta hydrolase [Rhizobium helianthi]|uniref:Palmitoyl-protein thioesterase ABHD10, mitochondrial n=1 Tax=Rhizobium helianthi TaxID=1132695 RepID=A0ABW4M036_9HYPH